MLVRFSAIGDCVMTAWAATALREALPTCRIVWAVQPKCAAVIDGDRLVDRRHEVDRDALKKSRWSISTWRKAVLAYTGLRQERFDVGFDFQGHSKTALCLALSGAKRRYASRATDALARLCVPVVPMGANLHEVERAMALVRVAFEIQPPVRPIMPAVTTVAKDQRPLVTIQTGAGEAVKQYPPERWASVARRLASSGHRVVALGAPSDPRIDEPLVEDLVGRLTLAEAMAWVAASELHLAADTGTGHIAAAYGVPVVSVFGKNPAWRFRPYTTEGRVLERDGSPLAVESDEVWQAAQELLEARFARPH